MAMKRDLGKTAAQGGGHNARRVRQTPVATKEGMRLCWKGLCRTNAPASPGGKTEGAWTGGRREEEQKTNEQKGGIVGRPQGQDSVVEHSALWGGTA